jgi:zinc transporter ZupT
MNTILAIAVHKWAAALAIGISLAKSGLANGPIYKLLALFSVSTPLGIVIGIILSNESSPLV